MCAQPMTQSRAANQPTLMLSAGEGTSRHPVALFDDEITIGRDPEDGIFLADLTVAPHHATLRRTAEGYTLQDGGSLTGTYVNRTRIERRLLLHGDEIKIGRYRLTYEAPESDERSDRQVAIRPVR